MRDQDGSWNWNERLRGQRGLKVNEMSVRKKCLEVLNTINAKGMSGTADGEKSS